MKLWCFLSGSEEEHVFPTCGLPDNITPVAANLHPGPVSEESSYPYQKLSGIGFVILAKLSEWNEWNVVTQGKESQVCEYYDHHWVLQPHWESFIMLQRHLSRHAFVWLLGKYSHTRGGFLQHLGTMLLNLRLILQVCVIKQMKKLVRNWNVKCLQVYTNHHLKQSLTFLGLQFIDNELDHLIISGILINSSSLNKIDEI